MGLHYDNRSIVASAIVADAKKTSHYGSGVLTTNELLTEPVYPLDACVT